MTRQPRRRTCVAAAFAACAAVAWLGARQAPPAPAPATPPAPSASAPPAAAGDQVPTFRAGVDSVTVDAVVTDKQGKPVTDLTPEDFEIRESGKVQSIQTFKLVQIDSGLDDPAAQTDIKSFDDQARETAREDNRLYVIFLDDYHVQLANSLNVRERLSTFVHNLTPHDLVAIATPIATVSALTFSRDHDATAQEIMGFVGRKYNYTPRTPIEEQYAGEPPDAQERFRNGVTIAALSRLCDYLGTLRDGRKTILYVSEGMTGTLPAGIMTTGFTGPAFTPGNPSPNANSQRIFENASIGNELRDVFTEAARGNTAIYTLDPRGLVGMAFGADSNVSLADSEQTLTDETDLLKVIADETDGRAIVGKNDLGPPLRQMVQDSSTYYLIGYTSSLAPRDGKFHEIQVRVRRKDVEVRARKGYWAYSAEEVAKAEAVRAKPGPSAEVTDALDTLATVADSNRRKPLAVWIGAERGASEKAHVTLAWEAPTSTFGDAADTVDHVDVTATSIDGVDLYKGAAPRANDPVRLAGGVSFDAPAGGIHVKAVAENARGVRVDTEDVDFDVPDFTAANPIITTPMVFRGRTARDLQVVRTTAAPVPTPLRAFPRTARLLVRFGIYGPGGTTPAVTMRLLNQSGAVIAALPNPVTSAPNQDDCEFGLDSFPLGDYLVEITATSAADSVKKLLAIRIAG